MTRIYLAVLAVLLGCSTLVVAEEPSRGRVVKDAVLWRTDKAVATSTVKAGTILTITAAAETWYEVIIPDRQEEERALIARIQVELLPGTPAPPARAVRGSSAPTQAQRVTRQQEPQPAQPAPSEPDVDTYELPEAAHVPFARGFIALNGYYQVTANDFDQSFTFRQNAETAQIDAHHQVASAPGLSISGGGMLSRHVGAGVTVNRVSQRTSGSLSGQIPHPFFFNSPRSFAGDVAGLEHEELALHGQVRFVTTPSSRLAVSVFGGPSWFRVKQNVIGEVFYRDNYPYDQAAFDSVQLLDAEKSAVGFNVGGDATYFLTARVGLGFGVMFSRATLDLSSEGDTRPIPVRTGGVGVTGGLRFRF